MFALKKSKVTCKRENLLCWVTITPHMLHFTWDETKHYFDGKQGHKHCSHWELIRMSKNFWVSPSFIQKEDCGFFKFSDLLCPECWGFFSNNCIYKTHSCISVTFVSGIKYYKQRASTWLYAQDTTMHNLYGQPNKITCITDWISW
jgi:hypothetical protein